MPLSVFLRCAGPRLRLSTGLVKFTLVTLLSRYIRTTTDSSKLNTDWPTRSRRAMRRRRWPGASGGLCLGGSSAYAGPHSRRAARSKRLRYDI